MTCRLTFSSLATVLILVAQANTTIACLHAPIGYIGTLGESSQRAVIIWAEGREDLILQVDYRMAATGDLPETLAWIVPVPTVPDDYGIAPAEVFTALDPPPAFSRGRAPSSFGATRTLAGPHIRTFAVATVGDYEITPLQARGEGAAEALNRWLLKHGFGEVPTANMQYYIDRDWTFLAIKVNKVEGDSSLDRKGTFHPLRISFAADRVYYPLKFSSHQGVFKMRLNVLSDRYLQTEQARRNPSLTIQRTYGAHPSVEDAYLSERLKLVRFKERYDITGAVNESDKRLADWKEDLIFTEGGPDLPVVPSAGAQNGSMSPFWQPPVRAQPSGWPRPEPWRRYLPPSEFPKTPTRTVQPMPDPERQDPSESKNSN